MLWVDATISKHDATVPEAFASHFRIQHFFGVISLDSTIERVKPSVICFDFDFPTKVGLQLLQRTKQAHSRIPLLMFTVQHSESLAVWAFRSRCWDYLVKPVSKAETERCIVGLYEMLQMQVLQEQARSPAMVKALIPEENRSNGARGNGNLLLAYAIEHVEKRFREKISSSDVAGLCKLTPFQFSRLFKETYNLTFQEYVLRYRIREACRLLKNPAIEVTEVASLTGFNDPSYFGKIFRRYMSCSPSQYRVTSHAALNRDLLEDLTSQSARSEA